MTARHTPTASWPYCDGQCHLERKHCTHPHICPGKGLTEQELDARRAQFYPLPLAPHPWALPRRVQHRLLGALLGALLIAAISLLAGCGGGDEGADEDAERIATACQALTVQVPGDPITADRLTALWREQCFQAGGVVPPMPTPANPGPPAPTLCQANPQVCQ